MARLVKVAAAVIERGGKVLISRRPETVHQGGKWEFPGGKLESTESAAQALVRELREELGITPLEYRPLIQVYYEYPQKRVLLDVWRVSRFAGEACGREGQATQWLSPERLGDYEFPAANLPVISAARLPDRYVITPPQIASKSRLLSMLEAILPGCRLLLLRLPELDADDYSAVASEVVARCNKAGCIVMLTSNMQEVERLGAAGLHINSYRLMHMQRRPPGENLWLSASCHNRRELAKAQEIGVDFILLSPVQPTKTHPSAVAMGWEEFARLVSDVDRPVFALGGLTASDLERAWECGAQGVGGIRGFW